MANVNTPHNPEIWAAKGLRVLRANAIMPKLVDRDYEAEIQKEGDVINVQGRTAFTAKTKTIGTDYTDRDLAPSNTQLLLDSHVYESFIVHNVEQATARRRISEFEIPGAVKAIADKLDGDLCNEYSNLTGTAQGTYGSVLTYATLLSAIEEYDVTRNGPMDGNVQLVVRTGYEALNIANLVQAERLHGGSSSEKPIVDGIGASLTRLGINIYQDTNIKQTVATPTQTHNILFHRDAIALANRLLGEPEVPGGAGAYFAEVVDPVSQLTLRVVVSWDGKAGGYRHVVETLYGIKAMHPTLGLIVKT